VLSLSVSEYRIWHRKVRHKGIRRGAQFKMMSTQRLSNAPPGSQLRSNSRRCKEVANLLGALRSKGPSLGRFSKSSPKFFPFPNPQLKCFRAQGECYFYSRTRVNQCTTWLQRDEGAPSGTISEARLHSRQKSQQRKGSKSESTSLPNPNEQQGGPNGFLSTSFLFPGHFTRRLGAEALSPAIPHTANDGPHVRFPLTKTWHAPRFMSLPLVVIRPPTADPPGAFTPIAEVEQKGFAGVI
jgi:hypothetical protein